MSNYLYCQLTFDRGIRMPREQSTNPCKLPQQDRSRVTVEAILEATTSTLISIAGKM